MRVLTIIFSCWLTIILCTTAAAYDLQQGMHGIKWGSTVDENSGLKKAHETTLATYYVKSDTLYQIASQPVPGVFYGFYDDKFFAVFVRLRSLDQFSKLKQAFEAKYGDAKSSYSSQSKQQVYRWKDRDVKIKLKMIETMGQFKMAFYYSPLSAQLNEKRLEDIPPDLYKLIAPKEGESAKVAPLLGE